MPSSNPIGELRDESAVLEAVAKVVKDSVEAVVDNAVKIVQTGVDATKSVIDGTRKINQQAHEVHRYSKSSATEKKMDGLSEEKIKD